jgi:hypothetical protein
MERKSEKIERERVKDYDVLRMGLVERYILMYTSTIQKEVDQKMWTKSLRKWYDSQAKYICLDIIFIFVALIYIRLSILSVHVSLEPRNPSAKDRHEDTCQNFYLFFIYLNELANQIDISVSAVDVRKDIRKSRHIVRSNET